MRCLYLTKAVIKNFRSIEHLQLKNIGDITVLIGPNESGKSSILLALSWFGNDKPINKEDSPINIDTKDDDVIVELYFKIIDGHHFLNLLNSKINEELENSFGKGFAVDLNGLKKKFKKDKKLALLDVLKESEESPNSKENDTEISTLYLKFQKLANGSFKNFLYDDELERLNNAIAQDLQNEILKNIKLSVIFNEAFEEKLRNVLLTNNIPENQIPGGINQIKSNPNFSGHLNSITEKLSSFGEPNTIQELISGLDATILPVIGNVPSTNITLNISGKNITLNPRNLLTQAYNQTKGKINNLARADFREIIQKALKRLKPNFIYLAEEMELKGSVKKQNSWSDTLREDNKEYAINSRLFSILGINTDEFDKMDIEKQSLILENRLDDFSNKLVGLWEQQRIRITHNVTPTEINLKIKEIDKNNNPIKTTSPRMRSRGFKWYLAYLITLEYLKNKENTILLLDDPAVFLHEKGQKDFLKTIEEVSKNVQVFYNTHLISLFDEKELDRVLLVELDEKNKTTVKKPWTNKIEEVAAPVYHALGFDKLIFEKVKKILFVEGISDKFIFEGVQTIDKSLREWYIHPLSGGNKLENELVERMKLLSCLSMHKGIEYYYVLDGDRKEMIESKYPEIKNKVIFLGNELQEVEDLFNKDFYLNCVLECYNDIFIDDSDKLRRLREVVKEVWKGYDGHKITKKIEEKFRENGLGGFSKVDVAILIKRKLKKGDFKKKDVSKLLNELKTGLKKKNE